MKYNLIVDYGKPYTEENLTLLELKTELRKLKGLSEKEDFAYFDVEIEDENGESVTEQFPIEED